MADAADPLTALLAPYANPDPPQVGRLVDVPPAVAEQALQRLLPEQRTSPVNLTQPPMAWLVDQARELDGRLVGSLTVGRSYVRFDGIQVPAAAAQQLAVVVAAAWPSALAAAIAEAWPSWTAAHPTWTGTGSDLLAARLPPDLTVVGLWWD
ncbi:hypothetical protein [Blastococcus sp. SYSU DS1024]